MSIYSEVIIKTVPGMKIAQYAVISKSPEKDATTHMERWANACGLSEREDYHPRIIGWDFPFLSKEQTEVFGMRGYVSAVVLPDGVVPECDIDGADIVDVPENRYVMLTVTDPHSDSFRNIPNGYRLLFEYIEQHNLTQSWDGRIAFEEEYVMNDVPYMDIYVPIR